MVDRVAREEEFTGVVRIDSRGDTELAAAYGLANRAAKVENTVDTRFAIASGTKGLTALAVVSLVEDGTVELSTTARSLLGDDLRLIDDAVTIEHLLSHRSGIGDYFDEETAGATTDYALPVPAQVLDTTESYLAVLDGHGAKFAPGERFSYCNGGYVVLALVAERASGVPFHELVRRRVCERAGMEHTAFLRSDELPGEAALGYLGIDSPRTNVFHLPVVGSGDGGIYSTAADIERLWSALYAGLIVSTGWVSEMVGRPSGDFPPGSKRYGLGFWLHESSSSVILEGYDAGVSFRTVHDPYTPLTYTVISNTSDGAWPLARALAEHLG